MSVKITNIKGNIIKMFLLGEIDVGVHGCNCKHIMGGGLAKTVKEFLPDMYKKDCESPNFGGDIKYVSYNIHDKVSYFVNAYTQEDLGVNHNEDRLLFIETCFDKINETFKNKVIGVPWIGAGLAGGNWSIIKPIIEKSLKDVKEIIFIEFDNLV